MNRQNIDYYAILDVFDDEDGTLSDLFQKIAEETQGLAKERVKTIEEIAVKMMDTEWGKSLDVEWEAFEYAYGFAKVAFALGYTLGQMFEIDKSEEIAIKTLNQVKELIRESSLFRYLPIEPKTHLNSHPGNSASVTPTP